MASTEEYARLIIEVRGAEAITDTQAKLAALDAEAKQLAAGFKAGTVSAFDLDDGLRAIAKQTNILNRELTALERAAAATTTTTAKAATTTRAMAADTAAAATQTKAAGQNIIQFAYLLDDAKRFQYGFAEGMRGIGNNVVPVAQALGLGPGLAGTIAIVGTALSVAIPLGKAFLEWMKPEVPKVFTDEIGRLNDRIKTLQEKPIKLTADLTEIKLAQDEVERLTKAKQFVDALLKNQTVEEAASGKLIQEKISNNPAAKAALNAARGASAEKELANNAQVKNAEVELARLDRQYATRAATYARDFGAPAGEDVMREKEKDANVLAARQRVMDARAAAVSKGHGQFDTMAERAAKGTGPEQRDAQAGLAGAFHDVGADELSHEIEKASPERLKQAAKDAEQLAKQREASKLLIEGAKERIKREVRGAVQGAGDRAVFAMGEQKKADADAATIEGVQNDPKAAEARRKAIDATGVGPRAIASMVGLSDDELSKNVLERKRQLKARKNLPLQIQQETAAGLVAGGMDPIAAGQAAQQAEAQFRKEGEKQFGDLRAKGYTARQARALLQGVDPSIVGPPREAARQKATAGRGGFRSVGVDDLSPPPPGFGSGLASTMRGPGPSAGGESGGNDDQGKKLDKQTDFLGRLVAGVDKLNDNFRGGPPVG